MNSPEQRKTRWIFPAQIKAALRRLASHSTRLRRYLARNYPFLWQTRAHLLLYSLVTFSLVALVVGLLATVQEDRFINFDTWHLALFLFSCVFVLYWIFSYFFTLNIRQMPPMARDPPVLALVLCSFLIVLPSYVFLSVAKYRVMDAFPDPGYGEEVRSFSLAVLNRAGRSPIGDDGVISLAPASGTGAQEFQREMVCAVGRDLLPSMVRRGTKIVLKRPIKEGRFVQKVDAVIVGPDDRSSALSSLGAAYANTIKFINSLGRVDYSAHYCLNADWYALGSCKGTGVSVTIDCASIDPPTVTAIFVKITEAARSLANKYRSHRQTTDTGTILKQLALLDSKLINEAHGFMEEIKFVSFTQPADDLPEEVEIQLHKENERVVSPAQESNWFAIWLFIFGLLAITIRSVRLVGENSANYIFAALFIVPGAALFPTMLQTVIGSSPRTSSVDIQKIFIGYLVLSAIYLVQQALRRRCSQVARTVAFFNLFFLVVLSFFVPFMSMPFAGKLEGWIIMLAFLLYFGGLYELYYFLARIVRERPS